MADPKTRPTDASVTEFLASIPHDGRRADAVAVDKLLREVSGEKPVMWGGSIVGYGEITYSNGRGKQSPWPVIAFAPRKTHLVLYINTGIEPALFQSLGPHRRGVGCLYLKHLSDVDAEALRTLLDRSIALARASTRP